MGDFDPNKTDAELDEILSDVKSMLQEDEPDEPQDAAVGSADDIHIDYEKFYGELPPEPNQPEADADILYKEPITAYEQSRPPYQVARRAEYERERERERQAREEQRLAQEQEDERRMQQKTSRKTTRVTQPDSVDDADYAEWLYRQGEGETTRARRKAVSRYTGEDEPEQAPPTKKKKKGGVGRVLLIFALVLAALCVAAVALAQQPKAAQGLGARKSGCATILVAGTDEGGYRTDTMMLLSINRSAGSVSLISIPRDTLVYCAYSVPKINSAFGWAGGGEDGMEELMERVTEIIGFRPDGYVLVNLSSFQELVDLMGGVKFDVPVDMYYNDPSQNLYIDLKAGMQKLDGAQAMQVVRFRSGYADADLGRVSVQRDFVSAALKQWLSVKNVWRAPMVLQLLQKNTDSNLDARNYLWLAESLLLCDRSSIQTQTLPGTASYISGGSYYVLDAAGVADTVNQVCNPYEQGVAVSDLYIWVG